MQYVIMTKKQIADAVELVNELGKHSPTWVNERDLSAHGFLTHIFMAFDIQPFESEEDTEDASNG